jgi:hypothetical protein
MSQTYSNFTYSIWQPTFSAFKKTNNMIYKANTFSSGNYPTYSCTTECDENVPDCSTCGPHFAYPCQSNSSMILNMIENPSFSNKYCGGGGDNALYENNCSWNGTYACGIVQDYGDNGTCSIAKGVDGVCTNMNSIPCPSENQTRLNNSCTGLKSCSIQTDCPANYSCAQGVCLPNVNNLGSCPVGYIRINNVCYIIP